MFSAFIEGAEIKELMTKLLTGDEFDFYEMRSAEITTCMAYSLDGRLNKEWFDEQRSEEWIKWEEAKPSVKNIIKGKRKPQKMKIVLSVPEDIAVKVHPNAKALFLNLSFGGDRVVVTGASSQREFSLDKTLDEAWNLQLTKFFKKICAVNYS